MFWLFCCSLANGGPAAVRRLTQLIAVLAQAFVVLLSAPTQTSAADIFSYAMVEDDATLTVRGRKIRLFGIYIPPVGRTCKSLSRPIRCASRAVHALDFKIGANFVRCKPVVKHTDRSLTAVCRADGVDLSAYLISKGWAVALPDAPFEYYTLERIAKGQNLGVWGFQVDSIIR